MDKKTKLLIAFPVVLVIILMVIAGYIPFAKDFSTAEEQILEFIPADLKIKEEIKVLVSGYLKSPMDFISPETVRKSASEGASAPEKSPYEKRVSLIVISGKKKLAIIEGRLVTEGDIIDGIKIAAIEPGRVILRNKTSLWLDMKK